MRQRALDDPGIDHGDSAALQRSIDNALTFYREGGWGRLCTLLDKEFRNYMRRHQGQDVEVCSLLRAMFARWFRLHIHLCRLRNKCLMWLEQPIH